jgi:uncharacterized coiled-coil protein SlyX
MDNRLVDLEIRYTHLERQHGELNQVVFEQQKLLDRLVKEVAQLRARAFGMGEEASNEKPPHY